jgi:hypothetical protein
MTDAADPWANVTAPDATPAPSTTPAGSDCVQPETVYTQDADASQPVARPDADDVLDALVPGHADERARGEWATDARANGTPVPAEVGDDTATIKLKTRLARAHLRDPRVLDDAVDVLHDIAMGNVDRAVIDKNGDERMLPALPSTRGAAAKALLDSAAKVTTRAPTHIEHAQILNAGDLIANVDPNKLRAAIEARRK